MPDVSARPRVVSQPDRLLTRGAGRDRAVAARTPAAAYERIGFFPSVRVG